MPTNPISYAWQGECKFAVSPLFRKFAVTKVQYEEFGHNICKHKFYN